MPINKNSSARKAFNTHKPAADVRKTTSENIDAAKFWGLDAGDAGYSKISEKADKALEVLREFIGFKGDEKAQKDSSIKFIDKYIDRDDFAKNADEIIKNLENLTTTPQETRAALKNTLSKSLKANTSAAEETPKNTSGKGDEGAVAIAELCINAQNEKAKNAIKPKPSPKDPSAKTLSNAAIRQQG